MNAARDHEVTTIAEAASMLQAHMLVTVLHDAGIEATAVDVAQPSLDETRRAGGRPVPVRVAATDAAAARAALARHAEDAGAIDWNEVDVGEREDDLPLRTTTRMPVLARVAFTVAIIVAVITAIAGALVLIL